MTRARLFAPALAALALLPSAALSYAVRDVRGNVFEFSEPPKRCATIVPSVTQNLFAIGAGENLIANSRFCDFPEEAKSKIKIGGFIDPDYEKILELKPDVVIVPFTKEGRVERRLEKLGVKCFVLHGEGVEFISADIRMLGRLMKKEARADAIAGELDALVAQKFAAGKNRRAIFMFGKMAAGKGSFVGDIVRACGLQNCADSIGAAWAEVSREFVLSARPEIIFAEVVNDAARAEAEHFYKTDPIWRTTPAAKNSAIFFVPRNLVIVPSARIALALKLMRECVEKYDAKKK